MITIYFILFKNNRQLLLEVLIEFAYTIGIRENQYGKNHQ